MDWSGLLRGELRLTFDILAGLAVGMLVLRSGLADKLMKRLLPLLRRAGIGPVLGMALTISLGSAKAGAAFIASALNEGRLGERPAKWGTLMLSFPAYLHRWPSTMVMAVSLAGLPGAIFGATLLARSAARFVLLAAILRRGEGESGEITEEAAGSARKVKFGKRMLKTLPIAWFFYGVAYALVPWAEEALRSWLLGGTAFLPLAAEDQIRNDALQSIHPAAGTLLATAGCSGGEARSRAGCRGKLPG